MHIHISNVVAYLVSNIFNYIIILHHVHNIYVYIIYISLFLCIISKLLYNLQFFYLPY